MDRRVCFLFLALTVNPISCQENKEDHHHSHSIEFHDFTIKIDGLPDPFERVSRPPTPPVTFEQLTERHQYQLKKTKIKFAALATIAASIVTGTIALIMHFNSNTCGS